MTNKDLENLIYEFGHIQYRLGRMETDEKSSTKDYSKALSEKDKIVKMFEEHFKDISKALKTLNV
jgi:hypothetical protein